MLVLLRKEKLFFLGPPPPLACASPYESEISRSIFVQAAVGARPLDIYYLFIMRCEMST